MKQFIQDFKESKLLKVYSILFSLINLVYVYFEVSKAFYIQKHSLDGTIEKYQFEYLSSISNATNFLESLITLICIAYLIKVVIKKDKTDTKLFLIANFALFIILTFVSYLVSIIFLVSFWPLTLILYSPFGITFIFLVYIGMKTLYKKIFRNATN